MQNKALGLIYHLDFLLLHDELKDVYKTFLQDEFLPQMKKISLLSRWFGYADKLSQLTNNQSYLLLFQAIASSDKDKPTDITFLKNTTSTIIQEYLQNSWFISDKKRIAAKALMDAIMDSKDVSALIDVLVKTQLDIADSDLAINQNRFFRTNISGKSRMQNSITTALTLATSLSMQTDTTVLVDGLISRLQSISPKNPPIKSLDDAKFFTSKSKSGPDKPNASVLGEALEKALEIKGRWHKY